MTDPTLLTSVILVLAGMLVVVIVLLLMGRRHRPGGVDLADLATARAEIARLEIAVAIETEKAMRVPALERERADGEARNRALVDEKAGAEAALAARTETVASRDRVITLLERRLADAAAESATARTASIAVAEARRAADEALAGTAARLASETRRAEELGSRLARADAELAARRESESGLQGELLRLRETLEQETSRSDEKVALLLQARSEMGDHFRVLAEEVMARHGESFTKLNREQIDGILSPLRERLGAFEEKIQTSHLESARERATLGEQIRQLADMGNRMRKETTDLTAALRGQSQKQGAWGEMVLATILERVGLREGEEYTLQKSFLNEDGQRVRPDLIVHLPGGQNVVVDSKVSLKAYEELCAGAEMPHETGNAAEAELARAGSLRRHVDSVRTHISSLGSKDYHALTGGLDYVMLFVPIEGALSAAMIADPALATYALERNVTLVTPTTLMIALRTVANFWQVERRNRNADEIADRAGKLYDKFVGVVTDLGSVGDNLRRSQAAFDAAMGKLSTGRGNVVNQLEQLRRMGARTGKQMPKNVLADDELGDTPAIAADPVDA